jgi:hypothetical protein
MKCVGPKARTLARNVLTPKVIYSRNVSEVAFETRQRSPPALPHSEVRRDSLI